MRSVALALLVGACASTPRTPGTVTMGRSGAEFMALAEGGDLEAVQGCQGGRHVTVALQANGLAPGVARVLLSMTADDGTAAGVPHETRVMLDDLGDGSTAADRVTFLLDLGVLRSVLDHRVSLAAHVVDGAGREADGAVHAILRLGPDACVAVLPDPTGDLPDVGPSLDAGTTPDTEPTIATDGGEAVDTRASPDAGAPIDLPDAGVRTPLPLHFLDATTESGLACPPGAAPIAPHCFLDDPFDGPGGYCVPEYFVGGTATGDYDGDGDDDVLVARTRALTSLYRNDGGFFVDVSAEAGLGHLARVVGAAFADVDGDADLDLFVSRYGVDHHQLWINDGRGVFADETAARGGSVGSGALLFGTTPAFGDYDRDGDLDVYVGEWRLSQMMPGEPRSLLLENDGTGVFRDVTLTAGVSIRDAWRAVGTEAGVYVFAPVFVDLDADRYPELLLVSDFGTSRVFHNRGDGTFDNATAGYGLDPTLNGMGVAIADVDHDTRIDVFVSAISGVLGDGVAVTGNRLHLGRAGLATEEVSVALGVRNSGWSWGAIFADFDSDGWVELAVTAGYPFWHSTDRMHFFYRSTGSQPFADVAPPLGLDLVGATRSVTVLDGDGDGDLDLLVGRFNAPLAYYRNESPHGHWLRIRARGTRSGIEALGARIEVVQAPGDTPLVAWVGSSAGYLGQSERVAHFGLGGRVGVVAEVRVIWPRDGAVTRLANVSVDRLIIVHEP